MLRCSALVIIALNILASCAPITGGSLVPLRVYATSAASPWLETAYDCAPPGSAIVLDAPDAADVVVRLTEPRSLTGPLFQIGSDDLLIVTHPDVAIPQLSLEQAQAVFAGQVGNWRELGGADLIVQVWVYAPTVDVQAFFEHFVLQDRPVSTLARLAVSAQDMSDSVGATPGSVGLLPRRWKAGNTREALIVAAVPVLALTDEPPQGPLAALLACMQARP